MKNMLKGVLLLLLTMGLLACTQETPQTEDTGKETESQAEIQPETESETEEVEAEPVLVDGVHTVSFADLESMLAANGLSTNLDSYHINEAYHGGQQMRICRTEDATYSVFITGYEDHPYNSAARHFYVAKTDNDGNSNIIYCDDFLSRGTPHLDVGQDINGDILVVTAGPQKLIVYVIDPETDAVTEYVSTGSGIDNEVYFYTEEDSSGYNQTVFDFENRTLTVFYNGGGTKSDNYILEWFTFDLETKQWLELGTYKIFEGLGRHCYLFPFPDGNGGVYIVGERDIEKITMAHILKIENYDGWLFDELKLFHIPDVKSAENITYTYVQEAYTERGDEGIWSEVTSNQFGSVFMDENGYLHVTYLYAVGSTASRWLNPTEKWEWRHAIFNGMECIYNEKIDFIDKEEHWYFKSLITQDKDGNLYMIVVKYMAEESDVRIYKANDDMGKEWTKVATLPLSKDIYINSISISEKRSGSLQDNIISFFCYANYVPTNTNTVFTFNLSLDDYSITKAIDLLEGYDLSVDGRMDKRAYNSSHTNKIVHTENGAYAAFVYNYQADDEIEEFHIVKIGADNKTTILHTDSYGGEYGGTMQDRFVNMKVLPDGKIYVMNPNCKVVYCVDPATDEVTSYNIIRQMQTAGQQADLFYDVSTGGTNMVFGMATDEVFSLRGYALDTEAMEVTNKVTYEFDTEILGNYTDLYSFSDGKGGAYIVAGNWKNTALIADKLSYKGHIDYITDTITLFYIPNLSEPAVQCITVQAPDESKGMEGIWTMLDLSEAGDVYMDAEGKIHILYTTYSFDLDDSDRRENPALIENTLKLHHAVYNGTELVSNDEVSLNGLTSNTAVRMAQTTDGTFYLVVCELNKTKARLDVYFQTEDGWALTAVKYLDEVVPEAINISSSRGGSVQENSVDVLIYALDNDVYYTNIIFAEK